MTRPARRDRQVSRTFHADLADGSAPEVWRLALEPEVLALAEDAASAGRKWSGRVRLTLTVEYQDAP